MKTINKGVDFTLEQAAYDNGFTAVCGVDEAGRGPLAGPVVAAAVILPLGCEIEGLNDSKKRPKKNGKHCLISFVKRQSVFPCMEIITMIDEIKILQATYLGDAVSSGRVPVPAVLCVCRWKPLPETFSGKWPALWANMSKYVDCGGFVPRRST